MDWLLSLDFALFRFINLALQNSLLDWLFPFLSWNPFFIPTAFIIGIGLIWKGGTRGRVFLLLVVVVMALGDGMICNSIKHAIDRGRPFEVMPDARVLVGRGSSASMPSSHAANWFAATTIAYLFYRRTVWFMLPISIIVGVARIYVGVHFPGDVLAGAVFGTFYAAAIAWSLDLSWRFVGQRWFPLWWPKLRFLLRPDKPCETISTVSCSVDQHWLRLGYLLIAVLFVARLGYLGSGKIELSEDEAYQWLWSKHLDLSYYSKPPLIAYAQFLGTALWGDREFGVRFFAPVIAATLSFLSLRFLAREVSARAGVCLLLIVTATPLLAVGATLMTIDPLSVLFWTAAMFSGWIAVQQNSTRHWLWTGLWMGLGFLSKYTALFQILCWSVFFVIWKPARAQLRRPGPYLALLIILCCTLPVLIWNAQHDWITLTHLAERGGLDRPGRLTTRFLMDFVIAEVLLLNPIFFAGMVAAAFAVVARPRGDALLTYLFSMGAPLFLFYLLYTLNARVQPNWIAPAVLPLLCLMVVYVERRWTQDRRFLKKCFAIGVSLGASAVIFLHDTNMIRNFASRPLPPEIDPLRRVRGWREMAGLVAMERDKLLQEGEPVFIIGGHYGITGLLSFYLPEAKAVAASQPLVYFQSSQHPVNQFYFWPGYKMRKGQNALYVREHKAPRPAPKQLLEEFESVVDLGTRDVLYRGRHFHRIQLFQCRNLR
ncbi:MAG: phosphatase PAP2 family protein [Verrucomicrobia bacterium]|nr:phosphatase PAP2 family protein [Verrucomicrobiota bacterium]